MTKLLSVLAVLIVVLAILVYFMQGLPSTSTSLTEAEARSLVSEFGLQLKNVSLLAPKEQLASSMEAQYGDFVTEQLISVWLADPQNAPGRFTSSPWPDRIDITSVSQAGAAFSVQGEIVEVTNEGGGIGEAPTEASRRPVTAVVESTDEGIRITSLILGAAPQQSGEWIYSPASAQGTQFQYPRELSTTYISAQAWPPTVTLEAGDYSCAEEEQKMVGDREYCVTTTSEGAAGSTYRSYTYATAQGDFLARVAFTLRFPQCQNYDEPKRRACTTEQSTYDIDGLADRIVSSIRMH